MTHALYHQKPHRPCAAACRNGAGRTGPCPAGRPAAEVTPQEIVVTGNTNREGQRKIDASYSISTASALQIREVQPTSTADLLKIVPGVWVESSGGQAGANVFIRGFPRRATRPS
jgi:outer membrane cobalamin receptor